MSDGDFILRVEELTKVFGTGRTQVRAVDGVSFRGRAGEIMLVMGPSGSGKTTLLTMIGGLLRPTSGRVWIAGADITGLKPVELPRVRRHHVGFVFQTFNLLDSLSALENVEVALNVAGVGGHEAKERARRLLIEAGLEGRLDFKARDLSGGEKQRVSIARALANEPRLLLADEPTANLDSRHGHEVMQLLHDLTKNQGRTAVVVSHDLRLRDIADTVLWLEDGRLRPLGEGEPDPYLRPPTPAR
ncbi:MAG: ABC transporter ATP-binding protein [Chloroflexi bacterium]|nr:ABC transporter ATP-binding protein [Chloroflexota bacterium]